MIDVKVQEYNEKEVIDALNRAPEVLRFHLIGRLVDVGQDITDEARSLVPVKSGNLRESIKFKVDAPGGNLKLEVKPTGKKGSHAHLIERGVEGKEIEVHKRAARAQRIKWKAGKLRRGRSYWVKSDSFYTRFHHVTAQPFFDPAVQSAGDVGARLQAAAMDAARETQGGK